MSFVPGRQKVVVDAYRVLLGCAITAGCTSGSPTPARSTCLRSMRAATSSAHSEFAMAAQAMGTDYPRLIDRIVNLALERYGK